MFVLVRHAHAGKKQRWRGPDADRPLSTLGHRQARGLVAALSGIEVRALRSSPALRCRQTLMPLAAARGLRIDNHPLLAIGAPTNELFALLSAPDVDGAVFCTHREVLDALAEFARAQGSTCVPRAATTAKGGAWVVDRTADPAETLRYIAPADG
ncbi:SixA phosphatase family protein [Rhodococcus opacus]|nr:histidine phosphatase family protein [Rhodococcus opacus]MDX5964930.1 histidine phosphatase family protein [Rhodococcus opacus]NKY74700.1 histidine phosphatase family protein [Rhodococcus opacus]UNN01584.1 histidine phosphatase family protein [Rhodococcus opacus]UZG52442.1 histidine phosphatase family protein [Rhodococcus opacus]CAG7623163.1 putative 8-oxo-dGTP diphosphatase 1 [Rhodococcus opacus]